MKAALLEAAESIVAVLSDSDHPLTLSVINRYLEHTPGWSAAYFFKPAAGTRPEEREASLLLLTALGSNIGRNALARLFNHYSGDQGTKWTDAEMRAVARNMQASRRFRHAGTFDELQRALLRLARQATLLSAADLNPGRMAVSSDGVSTPADPADVQNPDADRSFAMAVVEQDELDRESSDLSMSRYRIEGSTLVGGKRDCLLTVKGARMLQLLLDAPGHRVSKHGFESNGVPAPAKTLSRALRQRLLDCGAHLWIAPDDKEKGGYRLALSPKPTGRTT